MHKTCLKRKNTKRSRSGEAPSWQVRLVKQNMQYTFLNTFFKHLYIICIVPMRLLAWKIRVSFPGESHLRPSCAIQPTILAGCFSVFIILRKLTWTTGSLTCAQMWMHAIAHGGYEHRKRVCTEIDSGRKIPCRTEESNLRRWSAGPMLYQLSYIPACKGTSKYLRQINAST